MSDYRNRRFSEEEYKEIEEKTKELNGYRNYYGAKNFGCAFTRQADGKGCLRYYDILASDVVETRSVNKIREAVNEMYHCQLVFLKDLDKMKAKEDANSIKLPISISEKLQWQSSGSCMDDTEYGKHYYNDYITCKKCTREEFNAFIQELVDFLKQECGECDDIEITQEEGYYDRYVYMFKNYTFRLCAIYYVECDETDSVEFAFWNSNREN